MDAVPGREGLTINGVALDVVQRGSGRPILYLHAENGPDHDAPVLDALAAKFRLIAPAHPGFGHTPLSDEITGVDDLALFYDDLLEQLDLRDVLVVGVSFGAWIAAELAVLRSPRVSGLVLADAVGIKISDRTTRDIVDIYAHTAQELAPLAWADPQLGTPDTTQLPDEKLLFMARARESTARYGWVPYLHNPKLRHRLRRIAVPSLVLWGEQDRIVTPAYGRAFSAAIPGARFETIRNAGHFPQLERPEAFAAAISQFAFAQH